MRPRGSATRPRFALYLWETVIPSVPHNNHPPSPCLSLSPPMQPVQGGAEAKARAAERSSMARCSPRPGAMSSCPPRPGGVAGDARAGGAPARGSSASSARAAVRAPSRELRAPVRASCGAAVGSLIRTSSSIPRRLPGGELHRRPGADERNQRGLLMARRGPVEPCCGGNVSLVAARCGSATDTLFSMLQ
jgi:hypothetical protein